MMRRRTMAAAVFLLAMLAAPRRSEAGLLDFIWEMSGPQMLGPGIMCMIATPEDGCFGKSAVTVNRAALTSTSRQKQHGPYLFLHGDWTFSTGKDAGQVQFDFFETHRLAFAPQVMFRSGSARNVGFFHGGGGSYEVLFGSGFDTFDKFGFVVTPVEAVFEHVSVAFRMRIYPNGFTPDEFGQGPRHDYDRPLERTYGFSLSLRKFPW